MLNVLSFFRDEVLKSKRISQYPTPEFHSVSLLASGSALQAFRGAAQFCVRVLLWINCPESYRGPTSGYFQNKAHLQGTTGMPLVCLLQEALDLSTKGLA